VQEVMRANPQIQELSLCNNSIDDGHFRMLVEVMRHSACRVRRLDASHNRLSGTSLDALVPFCACRPDELKTNAAAAVTAAVQVAAAEAGQQAEQAAPPADVMLLSVADALSPPDTDSGTAAPDVPPPHSAPALGQPGVTLLTSLVLSGNPVGDASVAQLCAAMTRAGSRGGTVCELTLLQLQGCALTERCAPALEQMLANTQTLATLSIAWNNIGARSGQALARGVEANVSLRCLNVAWAGLGDSGCSHLAAALRTHSTLARVDLSGNNAGFGACTVLAEVLTHGESTLAEVALHHNALTQQGVRRLLNASLASHTGVALHLQRASFVRADDAQLPSQLDRVNPDGHYAFDLADPVQRQMATDVLACATCSPSLCDLHEPCAAVPCGALACASAV
jgi:Leucine Rich repeat